MGTHPVPGELDAESLARMASVNPGLASVSPSFVQSPHMLYQLSGMLERDLPSPFARAFGEAVANEMDISEAASAVAPATPPPPVFGGQRVASGARDPTMGMPSNDACRGIDVAHSCGAGGDGLGRYQTASSRAMAPPVPGHPAYIGAEYGEGSQHIGGGAPLAGRKVMARKPAGMLCRDGTGQPMIPPGHDPGMPASSGGPGGQGQWHMFPGALSGSLGSGTSPGSYPDAGLLYCRERF